MIDVFTFERNCKAARAAAAEAAEERARNLRDLTALCSLTGYKHNGPGASVLPDSYGGVNFMSVSATPAPLTVFDSDGNVVLSGPVDEVLFALVEP
jgi:hypothetical protein